MIAMSAEGSVGSQEHKYISQHSSLTKDNQIRASSSGFCSCLNEGG